MKKSDVHVGFASCLLALVAMLCLPLSMEGQRGGEQVYTFLKLSPSSRITALGGSLITVRDDDAALALHNPAALNPLMDGSMTFQYHFLFDGIADGYAGYAMSFPEAGLIGHGGIQFIQYGDFKLTDEYGNQLGTFKANEIAITAGVAKELTERLFAGVNLRFVQSSFESYGSAGLMMDIGGMYMIPKKQITFGLAVQNVGVQLSTYSGQTENLPINVLLGFSKRLEYLPFRFSVTAHSLNQWDLLYDSPLGGPETTVIGEESREKSALSRNLDNVFRHLIFSGEFLLGREENFRLRFGYHHQRRKELSVSTLRSFSGFSVGVGIRIKQFTIDYGLASYHIAGSTKHIGISTNLDRFRKEKIVE